MITSCEHGGASSLGIQGWSHKGNWVADAIAVRFREQGEVGFDDFPAPVSITLGLDTQAEMTEFYEVNANAKSVSTNLAFTLLSKMAEEDPALQEALEGAGKDWITRGQDVMKALEGLMGPWKGRFQPANVQAEG